MSAACGERARVERALREAIESILPHLPPCAVRGDRHLRDLGADSVDRVEIVLGVMRRLAVDHPLSAFSDAPTVDALVDALCAAGEP